MNSQVYIGIFLLYVTGFRVPVEAKNYYFSQFCSPGLPKTLTVETSISGANMTGSIKPGSYYNGVNCYIVLNPPPDYGIILSVKELELRTGSEVFSQCEDTITISEFSGNQWSDVLIDSCSYYASFGYQAVSRPMRINFKTSSSTLSKYGKGFHIVYTTYYTPPCSKSNSFRCTINDICISESLRCESVSHCGDDTDDEWSSECINAGVIAGAVIGSVVFIIIVVAVIVVICRRRRVVIYGTTTMTTPKTCTRVYPQQSACPQQGLAFENQTPLPGYQQQQVPQKTHYYTQP